MLGLLPGAAATVDGWAVITEPPMTIEPGLPPGTNTRFEGIGTAGVFTRVAYVRLKPKVTTFTRLGEKICVSCKLKVWASMSWILLKNGSTCGRLLKPLSMV